ncbi:MAG: GTP-binding protein [Acidimicrobiia bacterium]
MPVDDAMRAEHVFKLLVTGPSAAGKTTLIQAISHTPVVETDVATTGDESAVKARTTVAMDFGTYALRGDRDDAETDDIRLLMFGTPGQRRFWFMTDVLKGDVDAVVYVIDADAEHTHAEAGEAMRALLTDLRVPLVVAVNRCDDPARADLVARSLGALVSEAVVPCQLVHAESARAVVIEALIAVLDRLERDAVSVVHPVERARNHLVAGAA